MLPGRRADQGCDPRDRAVRVAAPDGSPSTRRVLDTAPTRTTAPDPTPTLAPTLRTRLDRPRRPHVGAPSRRSGARASGAAARRAPAPFVRQARGRKRVHLRASL